MTRTEQITFGNYYHIYNCGINGCTLFSDENDYLRFIDSYKEYIVPVMDTLAWCLMGNHFHILVRVKLEDEILSFHELIHNQGKKPLVGIPNESQTNMRNDDKWTKRKPNPSKQLSHILNGYAQYFNKKQERHGSLFEKPFRRKLIDNENYLKKVLVYIHANPIHHGFTDGILGYPWTSYLEIIQEKSEIISKELIRNYYGSIENFKFLHKKKVDVIKINQYLNI